MRKARDLCLSVGVAASVEDSAGGDIVSAAIVHVAASMPVSGRLDAFLPSGEVSEHIAHDPVVPHHGRALVPVGPAWALRSTPGCWANRWRSSGDGQSAQRPNGAEVTDQGGAEVTDQGGAEVTDTRAARK